MSNIAIAEVRTMAKSSYKSGMFGIKNEEQAFTLMLIAQAENIHPMSALMKYDIIQGRPALKATEVLSRFQQSGGTIKWINTTQQSAKALFIHPQGGEAEVEYTMEDAQLAGLTGKDNWKKRPKEMLRARCVSSGVRMVYPACLNNMHSTDEVEEFEPIEPQEQPKQEEQVTEAELEPNIDDLKKSLARTLQKDFSFTGAMIKEFADANDLSNNEELLSELVSDNDKLINYVDAFEKGL